ncbi:MAG TPA: CHAT domain-containing protein [Pyrinomonadaceae bacterium]|nr:CHAT domain-containing protein [Pyrinomonadaceae bacterium]
MNDPLPQTVYRPAAQSGKPILASAWLGIGDRAKPAEKPDKVAGVPARKGERPRLTSRLGAFTSKEEALRKAAEIMLAEGRYEEARLSLELLKQEEYFDLMGHGPRRPASFSHHTSSPGKQAGCQQGYQELRKQLAELSNERAALREKQHRSGPEDARLAEVEDKINCAGLAYQKFLDDLLNNSGDAGAEAAKYFKHQHLKAFQSALRQLGRGTVALYTLMGNERYHVFLVTPDVIIAGEETEKSNVSHQDLEAKVTAFRKILERPADDPRPLARELYEVLLGPVAQALKKLGARTLMWSLDRDLRYLPVAALHDGRKYLVESYRNVMFTPASYTRLRDAPNTVWQGLGMGVSEGEPPLPGARRELYGIFGGGGGKGPPPIPGQVLLNQDFTKDAMRSALRRALPQGYKAVHIASHFSLKPGPTFKADSYLLLGQGRLTIEEVDGGYNLFDGVELLTLSACDTAVGQAGADGREVEGFGVLAQDQGAKSVIATLWGIDDEGTSPLMRNFYSAWRSTPSMTKAEALRRAQMSLLKGEAAGVAGNSRRGAEVVGRAASAKGSFKVDPGAPYAHPYYWAPFILIGNWQ